MRPPRRNLWSILNRGNIFFSIFTSFSSCPRKCYDNYATRLRQAAVPCEFLGKWRDIEIHVQLQLIEKGKLKGVRRLLLSKPHTLEEALDFARTQEVSDKQATKIETVQQSRRASPDDEKKLYKVRPPVQSNVCSKGCFSCGGIFLHAGVKTKSPAWRKRCWSCNRMNHFAKCCRIKGKVNKEAIKTVCEEEPSDSSDTESLCRVEEVGALEDKLTQTHKMY